MIGYLTTQQLDRLKQHQYSVCGRSVLEEYLQPFWCWLVNQMPLWLAPNLITFLGLMINVATTLLLACYCPRMTEEAPRWTYMVCGLGLFIYQALDAIDGKQARRTGNQSPLGELFDHGCDSISMIFVCAGLNVSMQFGYDFTCLLLYASCAPVLFYCAHWQAYVTGTLRFHKFDVTEAQFLAMGVFTITSILGPQIWSIKAWTLGISLRETFTICTGLASLVQIGIHFKGILGGGPGKNGTTVAGNSVISPAIPIGMMVALFGYICTHSDLLINYPTVLVLGVSIAFSKLTMKLVVAHMSKSAMEFMDSAMIAPGLLVLNIYLRNIVNPYVMLLFCSALAWYDIIHYYWVVVLQLAHHLEINIFTIKYNVASN